jgi:hypothetical protein
MTKVASSMRKFEVIFPVVVEYPARFLEAVDSCFAIFGEATSDFGPCGFSVTFRLPLTDPYSANRVIDALTECVCRYWQARNPTMVMWASELGFKPLRSDGAIIGYELGVFQITCEVRQDHAGRNPHNPDARALRAAHKAGRWR